jgi:TetR/AcrR family transcriptional regulator, transcriptional repressor of bet genes
MRQSVHRQEPCERRRHLIEATLAALAKHGSGRVSVRLIALEAQVSPGLITHHFGSIETLVAAASTQMGEDIRDALDREVEASGTDPRTRLMAFVSGCFRHPALAAGAVASWVAVTGLAPSMPPVAEAQSAMITQFRARIAQLMTACAPDRAHDLPAKMLAAVIEGLWMEMSRETASVTVEEAERLTLHWLRSLGLFRDPSAPAVETDAPQGRAWGPRLQAG